MADKLRLNKGSLREQDQRLRSFLEFLPTLRLRQRQLQAALARVREQQVQREQQRQQLRRRVEPWAPMLASLVEAARPFAEVAQVVTRPVDIAGVRVPQLHEVRFAAGAHDLLATPPALDDAVAVLRDAARLAAEREVLRQQQRRLAHELSRTSQRINLYDEVLVPQARRNIRRLRVYLGDQQTAAVCRAKLAKAKVQARAEPPPKEQ